MELIRDFRSLGKSDTAMAGGKGASLGEMTHEKIPVPPGFVITAQAFERFLEETDLSPEVESELNKINYKDMNSVDRASNVIRDSIHDARMPKDIQQVARAEFKGLKSKFVAVRSSATAEDSSTASWAGELESYLNTTEKVLLGNVKKCWSSLFTPRAIFYRFEKGMRSSKVSVAVVVQVMVESEVSGIAFTVHPVTKDYNQMIIEAGFGLGEAVVSGQITPDSYIVSKRDFRLLDINLAAQEKMLVRKSSGGNVWRSVSAAKREVQKLTGRQIVELAKLCIDIERHYGKPQDIEWAFAKKKFSIVQSRPITTLGR
ncbi:MAG: PEP/pyruvate-binding domain-containing protein [bacterium]|nr:PEP/pyruvate-binding domain-containing protein [bacterium]